MFNLFLLTLLFRLGQPASIDSFKSSCNLPSSPANGQYSWDNQTSGTEPGHKVKRGTVLQYSCSPGYILSDEFSVCQGEDTWTPVPTCTKNCTLYGSYTVNYLCYSPQNLPAPCQPSMQHGSNVVFECKAGHSLSGTQTLGEMSCRDGSWSLSLPECEPVCGLEVADGVTYIMNAPVAKKDSLPWHVAVYEVDSPIIKFICGGTILSSRLVLGAAHCFYDPRNERTLPAERYRVAANKHYQAWDHPDEENIPKSEVLEIRLHEWYRGEKQQHQNDIAILVLKSPFEFTDKVCSICYDVVSQKFDNLQLSSESVGKLAGWGETEKNQLAEELRVLSIPFIDHRKCIEEFRQYRADRFMTEDKICAGYLNGSTACLGDSGGGLVFPDQQRGEQRWWLRGIVSLGPRDGFSCRSNTYTAFTRLFALSKWFKQQINDLSSQREIYRVPGVSTTIKPGPSDGCPLPTFPTHGRYVIAGQSRKAIVPGEIVEPSTYLKYSCNANYSITMILVECQENGSWSYSPVCERVSTQDASTTTTPTPRVEGFKCVLPTYPANGHFTITGDDKLKDLPPGTIVEENTFITYFCDKGYKLSTKKEFSTCEKGKWNTKLPACIKKCILMRSLTVNFNCTNRKKKVVPCSGSLWPGSVVISTCKPWNNKPSEGLPVLTCGDNGHWDNPRPECIQECGLEKVVKGVQTVNKTTAPKGTYTWHVGLFIWNPDTKEAKFLCGGSLIYSNLVISAAHCLTVFASETKRKPEEVMVAAGKSLVFWDNDLDENRKLIQKSQVIEIHVHESYGKVRRSQEYDLGLLKLATPFELSKSVLPICLDLKGSYLNNYQTGAGNIGKMAGWGELPTGKFSEQLKDMELSVFTIAECRKDLQRDQFNMLLTADKFCAGHTNNSFIPCRGDSGGGLVFNVKDDDSVRWFLRGVASGAPYAGRRDGCLTDLYMTFTSIFRHRDWLAGKIKQLLKDDLINDEQIE